VPFFFKQWGAWAPDTKPTMQTGNRLAGHFGFNGEWSKPGAKIWCLSHPPAFMVRVGKHEAGRLLDGREWNELPEVPLDTLPELEKALKQRTNQ